MSTLQFSLFFVALVVAYLLAHYRLVRFEKYLKEIAGLKLLNDRLQGVSDVLERVRLDTVEERLAQLHEDLVRIEDAHARAERAIARAAPQPTVTMASDVAVPTSSDRIRSVVENRLLTLGYGDLRILTDLSDADPDDMIEVLVECEKANMPYKGSIVTRNAAVVDVRLQSVAQSFP